MVKKVAFITGGASRMGLAVATSLASRTNEGWDLHLVDLNASAGESAVSSLGPKAHFHKTNVTDSLPSSQPTRKHSVPQDVWTLSSPTPES